MNTLGRTRGRMKGLPPPSQVFDFFFLDDKTSIPDVFSSCSLSHARILRQVKWWSVTMVTRYDVISSRCSSHFWVSLRGRRLKGKGKGVLGARETRGALPPSLLVRPSRFPRAPNPLFPFLSNACHAGYFWVKIHVFSTSFNNKSKACGWNDAYLCVVYVFSTLEFPFIAVFTWFLILGKIQDRSQDCEHCWWRHRPPAALSPIKYISSSWENWKIKDCALKAKSVRNTATYQKLLGGVPSTPPPPTSTTVGGM